MSITFNVNQKAREDLGKHLLKRSDVLPAVQLRFGEGIEASSAAYASVSYNAMDDSLDKMYEDIPEKLKSKIGLELAKLRGAGFSHPFVEAIHTAYDKHYPLMLSPDMVWLCIEQGLANHINENSETLRKKFVDFEGKKLIMLERDGFVKGSSHNDWQGCFAEFSDKLSDFIGKKRDLIVGTFSTTGAIEKAVSEVILMDSMKSYFKYGMRTMCGIPKITLEGTPEDWMNIRTRVENLTEFDLEWWTKPLLPVIDKLIETAKGNPDKEFWDILYKKTDGSGGPYTSGWFNVFFPYLSGVNYKTKEAILYRNGYIDKIEQKRFDGPNPNDFPMGLSKVPFKWQVIDHTYDMEFLGGMVGFHQRDDLTIIPNIGWAIRDTGTSRSGEIDPNENW